MKLVHLAQLKRALEIDPCISIRGLGLRGYFRGNIVPCKENEKDYMFHETKQGLMVSIVLGEGGSDPEALVKLLQEPDTLVLAVKVQHKPRRLAKHLVIQTEPFQVELKLHSQATLSPTEVPELTALNEENADWWLQRKLGSKKKSCDATVAKHLQTLKDAGIQRSVYRILNSEGNCRGNLVEAELRRLLYKLPPDLSLLCKTPSHKGLFRMKVERDALFALFGDATTYLEFLQQ